MLCPSCGAAVGDVVRLCDNCEAARAAKARAATVGADTGKNATNTESAATEEAPKETTARITRRAYQPAGFWLRFFAASIDSSILGIIGAVLGKIGVSQVSQNIFSSLVTSQFGFETLKGTPTAESASAFLIAQLAVIVLLLSFSFIVSAVYFITLESSPLQGTLGKWVFGLGVTDLQNDRIIPLQACFRYFSKGIGILIILLSFVFLMLVIPSGLNNSFFRGIGFLGVAIGIIGYMATYLAVAVTPHKQGIHDLLAHSLVVRLRPQSTLTYVGLSIAALVLSSLVKPGSGCADFAGGVDGLGGSSSKSDTLTSPPPTDLASGNSPLVPPTALGATNQAAQTNTNPFSVVAPPDVQVNPAAESADLVRIAETLQSLEKGMIGFGKAGDEQLQFADQLLFYSPEKMRLDIGFFTDPLDSRDRRDIVSHGGFGLSKEDRLPSVVVSIIFADKTKVAAVTQVERYSVRFYREFGKFTFSSLEQYAELKRTSAHAAAGELSEVSGKLLSGAKVSGRILGGDRGKVVRLPFEWGLRFDGVLNVR